MIVITRDFVDLPLPCYDAPVKLFFRAPSQRNNLVAMHAGSFRSVINVADMHAGQFFAPARMYRAIKIDRDNDHFFTRGVALIVFSNSAALVGSLRPARMAAIISAGFVESGPSATVGDLRAAVGFPNGFALGAGRPLTGFAVFGAGVGFFLGVGIGLSSGFVGLLV
jgi:hypothetical protein